MYGVAFRSFFKDFWISATSPVFLIAVGLVAFITVVTGPLGTYEYLPLPVRLIYWTSITLSGAVFFVAIDILVRPIFGEDQPVLQAFSISCCMAVFFSPFTMVLCRLLTSQYREPTPTNEVVLIVFFSGGAFYAFRHIFRNNDVAPKEAEQSKLGVERAQDVLAISADDHYVRIHTREGEHRRLMRFSDAVELMDGHVGAIVHRSHWVAAPAVSSVQKHKGRFYVLLTNGRQIPVSRERLDDISEVFGQNIAAA